MRVSFYLGAHGGFGAVDQRFLAQFVDRRRHVLVDELARLWAQCMPSLSMDRTHQTQGIRSLSPCSAPSSHHLTHRQSVAADNVGRVYLVLDQLVGALQQLRSEDDDRGGAVAHLCVLQLSQLD